jgi:hypoxanthine phosphoribosyltransferase
MSQHVLVTEEQIKIRLSELAKEIAKAYEGKHLVLVGILKGAFIITADLVRALHREGHTDTEVSFLILKSYYSSTTISKDVTLVTDIDIDPKERHLLLVDDIFDTGKSFAFVDKHMRMQGAASVEGFALLAKTERHEVVYRPKYIGFQVPNLWIEGYGMDSSEKGRGNPAIIGRKNE